jgi:hypothetical protein
MERTLQDMLAIDGKVFDAGSHGQWRARITWHSEVPPVNTDQIVCTVSFDPIGASKIDDGFLTTRLLKLRLSYFALAHSTYDANNTRNYQLQIMTLCADWLRRDQTEGELQYFGA